MGNLWQDFRYGLRMLLKKPGFTAAAVIVLGLGIGSNTAIFSLVNAFLLKPLQVENPSQLRGLYSRDTKTPDSYRAFSYPNYVDLREKNSAFSSLMAHNMALVGVAEGDTTRRAFADMVSANYFQTFGLKLFRGRTFTPAEEQPGAQIPVVITSYSYWKKNGSDPGLVGKTMRINGKTYTIIGIAPEGFSGTTAMVGSELYLPLGAYNAAMDDFGGNQRELSHRDNHALILVGRLKPGVTPQQADAQLAVVASQLERAYPAENKNQTILARPLSRLSVSTQPTDDSQIGIPVAILMTMAAVVLLIASLNLANMMLASGASRRKEFAVRLAIGSGRGRIVQQLLTEALILSVLGGIAGVALASWSTSLLIQSLSRLVPIDLVYSAGPDIRILAATLGFCVISTLIFGLGPAWRLARPDLVSDLKENAGEGISGGSSRLFSRRNLLVMAQLSLSLMMLSAAGLFVRSAVRASQIEPGFAIGNEAIAELDPSLAGYDEAHGRQMYDNLLGRLKNIPGVESAGLAATTPFGVISLGRSVEKAGDAPAKAGDKTAKVAARFNIVTADYFKALGIPLLQGRAFLPSETASASRSRAVILDKLAAGRLWPDQNPVGKHVKLSASEPGKPARDVEIVGVTGNVQERIIGGGLEPHIYTPFGQEYQSDMQIHLRLAARGPEAQARVLEAVRREIRAMDEHLPVLGVKLMREHVESSIDFWIVRTGARMLGVFGAVALLLAVVGLYGVKAYTVARRTREIGIRMALGANASDTLAMVLREGLEVTAVGVGLGLILALALGKVLSTFLYEVRAVEPVVLLAAPLVLTAISIVACYFPARRAARVDPMIALRYE